MNQYKRNYNIKNATFCEKSVYVRYNNSHLLVFVHGSVDLLRQVVSSHHYSTGLPRLAAGSARLLAALLVGTSLACLLCAPPLRRERDHPNTVELPARLEAYINIVIKTEVSTS